MKRILCAALIAALLATPALGARLYLKDGGVIQAKRVWRSGGKVYVLATRDTMTSFEPYEVNLKRTFPKPKRHKARVVRTRVGAARPAVTAPPPAEEATVAQKPEEKKRSFRLPAMPTLPSKSPDSLVPSSGSGGSIKKHKKEMAERLGE
jgi:hypothetical protein